MADFDPDKHCGAQRPNQPPGVRCTRPKGWGTTHPGYGHCKRHGGATRNQEVAAQREIARHECNRLGIQIESDPGEALLAELAETVGNVAYLRSLVQDLSDHPAPDLPPKGPDDRWERGEPGIYGRTYHATGIPTGEGKPHVLVQLYNAERKHLKDVADSALKAGVEARRIAIEEQQAEIVANVITRLFRDPALGLTEEQQRLGPRLAGRHLRALKPEQNAA